MRSFMGEYLPKNTFVEVKIETSPFLRTLATAAYIAQALDQNKVNINYLFSEHQDSWLYKENPMPALEFKTKQPSDRLAEDHALPQGLNFEDTTEFWEEVNQLYPENSSSLGIFTLGAVGP